MGCRIVARAMPLFGSIVKNSLIKVSASRLKFDIDISSNIRIHYVSTFTAKVGKGPLEGMVVFDELNTVVKLSARIDRNCHT